MANDDYEVGYRKPPHHSRFNKGNSGNPKGRPKQAFDFDTAMKNALAFHVMVKEGTTTQEVRADEAIVKLLLHKASAGEPHMLELLMDLYKRVRPSPAARMKRLIVQYVDPHAEREHQDGDTSAKD
jgi:hypothetical protein